LLSGVEAVAEPVEAVAEPVEASVISCRLPVAGYEVDHARIELTYFVNVVQRQD
jgi:hypothetical protein